MQITKQDSQYIVEFSNDGSDETLRSHFLVLLEALQVHGDRKGSYGENWKNQGWRGNLVKLRTKVERAWDQLFNADVPGTVKLGVDVGVGPIDPSIESPGGFLLGPDTPLEQYPMPFVAFHLSETPAPDTDDLIDIINYAVFCTRLVRDGNRDGSWRW